MQIDNSRYANQPELLLQESLCNDTDVGDNRGSLQHQLNSNIHQAAGEPLSETMPVNGSPVINYMYPDPLAETSTNIIIDLNNRM